jgi:hypothetical protein
VGEGSDHETPRTPFPAVTGVSVDERWFHEFRRDVTRSIKDVERLVREGAVSQAKQGEQLAVLIAQNADHEERLETLEGERNERQILGKAAKDSLLRKAAMWALAAVCGSGAVAVVGSTAAFVWFLVKLFTAAGAPGAHGMAGG